MRWIKGEMKKQIFMLLFCALVGGCSTTYDKKINTLYWPDVPETPRIKWVDYFRTIEDITLEKSFFSDRSEDLFSKPYGIAVTGDGRRICVTDLDQLVILYPEEKRYTIVKDDVAWPFGAAFTGSGKLYVTDMTAKEVRVFDESDKFVKAFGKGVGFSKPSGIAVDEPRNRVYVADAGAHTIHIFTMEGEYVSELGHGKGGDPGQFGFPSNIAVDDEGTVFVVDSMNFRVQVFSPEGEFLYLWGELGDTSGSFARPKGITLDSFGHVLVVDSAFQNVQVFEKTGQLLGWFSGGGNRQGYLQLPSTVAADDFGRIYVLQQIFPRVSVFQFLDEEYWDEHPEEKALAEARGHRFDFSPLTLPEGETPPAATTPSAPATEAPVAEEPVALQEEAPRPASPPGPGGEANLLIQMLEIRFGTLPTEYRERVNSADPQTLQKWGARILSAQQLEEVFSE